MNSIGENCNDLKKQYDQCFNNWFTERFLKGDTDDSVCAPIFHVYQKCVKEAIKVHKIEMKELEVDHLGTDKEHKEPEIPKKSDKKS